MADRIYGCEQIRSNPPPTPHFDVAGSIGWSSSGAWHGACQVSVQA